MTSLYPSSTQSSHSSTPPPLPSIKLLSFENERRIVCSRSSSITIFSTRSGKNVLVEERPVSDIAKLNERYFVSVGSSRRVHCWYVKQGIVNSIKLRSEGVAVACLSGHLVIVACEDGAVVVYDIGGGEPEVVHVREVGMVTNLSGCGRKAIASVRGLGVLLFEITRTHMNHIIVNARNIEMVCLTIGETYLVTGAADGTVTMYQHDRPGDVTKKSSFRTRGIMPHCVDLVGEEDAEKAVLCAMSNREIQFINATDSRLLKYMTCDVQPMASTLLSTGQLVTAFASGVIAVHPAMDSHISIGNL